CVSNGLCTEERTNVNGVKGGIGGGRIEKHSATFGSRRESLRAGHYPPKALLEGHFRTSQSRQTIRSHHSRKSRTILRQYLLAARGFTVFQKTHQSKEITVVIVIGLMMETQTSIRRSGKQ